MIPDFDQIFTHSDLANRSSKLLEVKQTIKSFFYIVFSFHNYVYT